MHRTQSNLPIAENTLSGLFATTSLCPIWAVTHSSSDCVSLEGRTCRFSEGPACQVRRVPFDDPFQCGGRDKHAPPTRARQAGPLYVTVSGDILRCAVCA